MELLDAAPTIYHGMKLILSSLELTSYIYLVTIARNLLGRVKSCKASNPQLAKNSTMKITLLRVIPNMTSIRFVTGKSSGILSDISSGILSGISSGILPGISSGILSGR